jgi:hypothetical protein
MHIQQFIRWDRANSYLMISFNQNEVINPDNKVSLYSCRFHGTLNNNANEST